MARQKQANNEPSHIQLPLLPVRDQVIFPGVICTLHVARAGSMEATNRAIKGPKLLYVVSQKDQAVEQPGPGDWATVGTVCEVLHHNTLADGSVRLVLRGLGRAKVSDLNPQGEAYDVTVKRIDSPVMVFTDDLEALTREVLRAFAVVVTRLELIPSESYQTIVAIQNPGQLADSVAHHLNLSIAEKQSLLEEVEVSPRLAVLGRLLLREERLSLIQETFRNSVEKELGETQRRFFLREQLAHIQKELGEDASGDRDQTQLNARLASYDLEPALRNRIEEEVARLPSLAVGSQEYSLQRSYLELLLDLPWGVYVSGNSDLKLAKEALDRSHGGLTAAKWRILEMLAVSLAKTPASPGAICLVGPPGVGKTALAKAIAEAAGRPFARIALGGVRDESEIRGHRKTYVGAMPGRLVQAIKQAGALNPVILLDEIDKLSPEGKAGPASALLEVLDPIQQTAFQDHYLGLPLDLSQVLFVATGNSMEGIPAALADRMEVIEIGSYSDAERMDIAQSFLIPKLAREHDLDPNQIISKDELTLWIKERVREPGLRGLERALRARCRQCLLVAKGMEPQEYLPPSPVPSPRTSEPGLAWGLAVGTTGGTTIRIEAAALPASSHEPKFIVTGNLGEVMAESARAALSLVLRAQGRSLTSDIHLHIANAGVHKDGPSAGLGLALALASALTGKPLPRDCAFTGEITLSGEVQAVGGLKEKFRAAERDGFKKVFYPSEQQAEVELMLTNEPMAIEAVSVGTVNDLLKLMGLG